MVRHLTDWLSERLKAIPLSVRAFWLVVALCGAYSPIEHIPIPAGTTVTLYVDNTSGRTDSNCGLSPGSANACQSPQIAYNNLCTNYDWSAGGTPRIQLTAGETFTTGLLISTDPNAPTPTCVGANYIVLDLYGATINAPGNALYLRFAHTRLRVLSSSGSNGTLSVSGATGSLMVARGGGSYIEPDGHINFGSVPNGYPQILTDEAGLVLNCPVQTCPEDVGNVITGGGGYFAQALNDSGIEWEGQQATNGAQVTIASGVTYALAFANAVDAAHITFFNVEFYGTNPTGPQYLVQKNGVVDANAQVPSGSDIVSGCYNASTNPYANKYMPGTLCGSYDFTGGRFSDPGTPLMSGSNIGPCAYNAVSCTNGYLTKGTDTSYLVQLGQITTNTNGTQYTVIVTQSTNSFFEGCTVTPTNPVLTNGFAATYTGPSSTSVNGYETIFWTGNGTPFPAGLGWWVTCRGHA